jgi:hypothetical protein
MEGMMATDERSRHLLYQRLEEALGAEPATTLMEHLPPTGWADVATKADLAALGTRIETRMEARFDGQDARFDIHDARFDALETKLEALEYKLLAAFRGELNAAITSQTRSFLIASTSLFVMFAAFVLGLKIV